MLADFDLLSLFWRAGYDTFGASFFEGVALGF